MARPKDDYVPVHIRIATFFEKYPNGTLTCKDVRVMSAGGNDYILYQAYAHRHPDDTMPGVGTAWDLVPGPTTFTEGSEAQNAETAAWGRALVAIGAADTHKGIATAEDQAKAIGLENVLEQAGPEGRANFSNACKQLAEEMGTDHAVLERLIIQRATKGRTNDAARITTRQIPAVRAEFASRKTAWRELQGMAQ